MSLRHRQEAAFAAMLAQPNLTAAALSCRISERTLRRWMTNKVFASLYEKERGKLFIGIVDLLKSECSGAVHSRYRTSGFWHLRESTGRRCDSASMPEPLDTTHGEAKVPEALQSGAKVPATGTAGWPLAK